MEALAWLDVNLVRAAHPAAITSTYGNDPH
jgi:hypothetical protein